MNLDFSEEQQMLRQSVRGLCERHSPIESVRSLEDDPVGFSAELWAQLGELGLLGVMIAESYGGTGMSALEAAVVHEELGRSLAPTPHLASCILSAAAIAAAGSDEQKQQWLPGIATGEVIITPAWLEPDRSFGCRGVAVAAGLEAGEYHLTGVKRHVQFASAATRLLVLVRSGEGDEDIDLVLVDPDLPGVEFTQQMSLASDTQYRVDLRDVRVSESERLGPPASGWKIWHQCMLDAIIMVAAQAMGGADRALELTVAYAKEREQFDKPIGSFQAISHYLADGATLVEGGRTLVHEAAWARSSGRSVERLAPMAKLFACRSYRDVTAMCEQVHGGYGFTLDYDIQLYFRRAKQLQISWWAPRYLEELVATTVLDEGVPELY